MAIFVTLLPLSFVVDDHGARFLLADHPLLMVGAGVAAVALWARYAMQRRESGLLR